VSVELPQFGTSLRIKGNRVAVGSGQEQFVVEQNWSGFKGRFALELSFLLHSAGTIAPGQLQFGDVADINLLCGRISRPPGIAAVICPG